MAWNQKIYNHIVVSNCIRDATGNFSKPTMSFQN